MHSCEGLWSGDLPQPTVLKIFHVRLIKLEGHPGCCLRRLVRRDEEKLLQASHPPDRLLKNIKRSTKKKSHVRQKISMVNTRVELATLALLAPRSNQLS
jgi:hypothetical protein